MNFVQAAITSNSFPSSLEGVWDMIDKHGDWLSDLDVLLASVEWDEGEVMWWTAPRWMTQGDILFFYHTMSAKTKVTRLLNDVERRLPQRSTRRWRVARSRHMLGMHKLLERASGLADRYSGTIFGCAEISGPTEYFEKEIAEAYFKSRFSAPLERVHIFEHPIPYEEFAHCVRIGQNVTTPLYKDSFDSIKRLLGRRNILPSYLDDAGPRGITFREIDKDNWPQIACRPDVRFIDEGQLRAYLLDFLLDELKDTRTPVLEECWCYRDGKRTGRADYFVRVHGSWIPMEAKLNINTEKDVLGQVARYTEVDSFVPTLGPNKNKRYSAEPSSVGLIADQSGIYVVFDGEFAGQATGEPVWRREDLNHSTVLAIRERINETRS
jgi:hypothetical protein